MDARPGSACIHPPEPPAEVDGRGSRRGTPGIHPLPPPYARVKTSDISVSQASPSSETAHSCRTTSAETGSSVIRT